MNLIILVYVLCLFQLGYSIQVLTLNGDWNVSDASYGEYTDLKATVPGGIYTDLMNNDVIGDIFFKFNDNSTRWIPRRNWTYSNTFLIDESLLNHQNIIIDFEGLDTYCQIILNDELVGDSINMFVRYIIDVKDFLKIGENKIEIKFWSPIEISAILAKEQENSYKVPPDCVPDAYRGECHVNMLRKMQASFSWDWGPSFPSVGIWKDVNIRAFNSSFIQYVVSDVSTKPDDTDWVIAVDVYLSENLDKHVMGKINYNLQLNSGNNLTNEIDVDQQSNEYSEYVVSFAVAVKKDAVTEWWPNGFHQQTLYNFEVTFTNGDEVSQFVQRIGFRNVELIQDEMSNGLSFYFKINNEPIFMKGSNEIPINVLPERGQNKTVIKSLLTAAKDSHMNMLRVWGGGVYESDYFYDLADEYGILIWQDFMFASAMYPAGDEYLRNVLYEVRHQVKRIRSHPSIVLYSGNNENEGNLVSNYFGTADNFTLYKSDYIKLYKDTVGQEFLRLTKNKGIFVGSSPTNGKKTFDDGFVSDNPGSTDYGDIHYYNTNDDSFESPTFPSPRFCSEYGYQALPSMSSLLTATDTASDLKIDSEFMEFRQHKPGGNDQIKHLISLQMNLPNADSENYIETFIYYNQIMQAMSIKIETEHYRNFRGVENVNTMGALYWQLNDVWVAPTWAGIDFTGRWKMLQYYVKNVFRSVLITGEIDKERKTVIYAINDNLTPEYVEATIFVYLYDSLEPIYSLNINTTLITGSSKILILPNIDDFLSEHDCGSKDDAKNNCFVYLDLKLSTGTHITNFILPGKLKDSNLSSANVTIQSVEVSAEKENEFTIVLHTDHIALFTWLDSHEIDGVFSDNGFIMTESTKDIVFVAKYNIDVDYLKSILTVVNFSAV